MKKEYIQPKINVLRTSPSVICTSGEDTFQMKFTYSTDDQW